MSDMQLVPTAPERPIDEHLGLLESEWDEVEALADQCPAGAERRLLEELRSLGASERMIRALDLRLQIGPMVEDPEDLNVHLGSDIEIRGHLRDAGSGSIYLGLKRAAESSIPVAVKLMHLPTALDERQHVRQLWKRECSLLAEFADSDGVPRMLEAGEHVAPDGRPVLFIATEYKHGLGLIAWSREHELDEDDRLALFVAVCDAVATIHSHGLIHGDLKPDNIQIASEQGGARPWILDLGLSDAQGRQWPGGQYLVGTPRYMSPEQVSPEYGRISDATDVYALGVILYELLEARPWLALPSHPTPSQLMSLLCTARPKRLPSISRRRRRAALEGVLQRATELRPERRYGRVSALRQAVLSAAELDPPRAGTQRRLRWPNLLALAGALALGLVLQMSCPPPTWTPSVPGLPSPVDSDATPAESPGLPLWDRETTPQLDAGSRPR